MVAWPHSDNVAKATPRNAAQPDLEECKGFRQNGKKQQANDIAMSYRMEVRETVPKGRL